MKGIVPIAAAAVMAALGAYYFLRKKTDRKRALLCKALATAVPGVLLTGFLLLGQSDSPQGISAVSFGWTAGWTLAAILCYMAADVLLECKFVAGAVCFSAGHICMSASFLVEGIPGADRSWVWVLCTAGLAAVFVVCACVVFRRYFSHLRKKKLFVPAVLYIVILSVMAALAVTAGICSGSMEQFSMEGLIPAAGGVSFVISDILLGLNRLGKKRSVPRGAAVLILYYLSVYLFAMRIWI